MIFKKTAEIETIADAIADAILREIDKSKSGIVDLCSEEIC